MEIWDIGLCVGFRWMHFKSLNNYEGQKGGVILWRFKSLMCVGFVHFKSQAFKNSWGQNNGGFDRVGWHHNVCKRSNGVAL
jgi:hypothetical protein